MNRKIALLVGALLMSLTACGGYSVASDLTAVQVGAGAEAKKVKGCKPPNERAWFGNDNYYYYPLNERYWEAQQEGGDGGRFSVITKDSVKLLMPVTIQFNFKTDCDTLTEFYTKFGRRSTAYLKESGEPENNDQWNKMLKSLVATPADTTLDRIIQDYNWRDVWQDPATRTEIESKLQEALTSASSLMVQRAQGEYFEDISVLIGQPSPPDELVAAVEAEQTAVAKARAAEAQAAAEEAQARAEVSVAQAQADKQREVIRGFGGEENYLIAQCIKTPGCAPYQPTYVVGGSVPK